MSEENLELAGGMLSKGIVSRTEIAKALDEAERRGAEKMRERAAKEAEENNSVAEGFGGGCDCADDIRALPLEGPKDGTR